MTLSSRLMKRRRVHLCVSMTLKLLPRLSWKC